MIVGIGTDVLDVARVRRDLRREDEVLRAAFTPREVEYCERMRYPARHYAARFAAKEAFVKALGTGFDKGIAWHDVEVHHDAAGAPRVVLRGAARRLAARRGVKKIWVSLSHTASLATATVVIER